MVFTQPYYYRKLLAQSGRHWRPLSDAMSGVADLHLHCFRRPVCLHCLLRLVCLCCLFRPVCVYAVCLNLSVGIHVLGLNMVPYHHCYHGYLFHLFCKCLTEKYIELILLSVLSMRQQVLQRYAI